MLRVHTTTGQWESSAFGEENGKELLSEQGAFTICKHGYTMFTFINARTHIHTHTHTQTHTHTCTHTHVQHTHTHIPELSQYSHTTYYEILSIG